MYVSNYTGAFKKVNNLFNKQYKHTMYYVVIDVFCDDLLMLRKRKPGPNGTLVPGACQVRAQHILTKNYRKHLLTSLKTHSLLVRNFDNILQRFITAAVSLPSTISSSFLYFPNFYLSIPFLSLPRFSKIVSDFPFFFFN